MLYDVWRQVASGARDHLALWDWNSNRRWSFAQLAAAAESASSLPDALVFPQGNSAEFVISVLQAWRFNRIVCPLEPGQATPELAAGLPSRPGIVHLKTTSATTGTPQLVAFTAAQLMADVRNIVHTMGLRPEWPNLGVISLAHSYGFSNLVLPLLLHGVPLLLVSAPLPEVLRQAAASQSQLTLPAVPALWHTWHDIRAIPPHVRLAISAGAPLPLDLEQGIFNSHGLKLHNFYGSTECGGIAYDSSPEPRQSGSYVGTPLHGVQVSLTESGCLQVRSHAVAETYWPRPNPNLGGGHFITSDLARLEEGKVLLLGRASDQINVAGRKVLPETIERALATHPQVLACLAFGIPSEDAQRGETIVACVAGRSDITPALLREFALSKLPAWQVPRKWWFVPQLQPNGRGKLSRAEWRKRFLAEASEAQYIYAPRKSG